MESLNQQIELLECDLQKQWDDEPYMKIGQLKEQLHHNIRWEAQLLKQKSRIKWLQDGDNNTSFFHAVIKDRRNHNLISIFDMQGVVTNDHKIVGEMAVDYFKDLFTATPYHLEQKLFEDIPKKVSEADNRFLTELPSAEEIYQVVIDLSPDSAPGVDGFTGYFFVACWDIIAKDIINMVQGFYKGDKISKHNGTTCLILIPKIDKAMNLKDYRPISLSNF
ncbi:hypothetical protein CASFOL_028247 [Castilleja foliolosa]|uniref:Uncharacterized protein n=1 Tax=Castilleja foliolosa TaxID=1961234 RepID=A0ABD3CE96_9LAMI